jgi:ABC-2 type transport system ATP-binding protein
MNALELEGIVKVYGTGQRALDGVDLCVPEGTLFGFLGVNGAGKTTTIRCIAGLLKADAGRIRILGKAVDRGVNEQLEEMGFVLDEPMYFDWMTPLEYWEFASGMYGLSLRTRRQRIGELLDFFDLQEKVHDPISTLSTGMKKKISLGAALIHRPQLIVLDEPLEGIDALAARAIKEALQLATQRGSTVLLTSHVLDTVERLCSEVAILHHGRIVLQCPMSDVPRLARRGARSGEVGTLEELFLRTVSEGEERKRLSFFD